MMRLALNLQHTCLSFLSSWDYVCVTKPKFLLLGYVLVMCNFECLASNNLSAIYWDYHHISVCVCVVSICLCACLSKNSWNNNIKNHENQ